MKSLLLIPITIILIGCSTTVPVKRNFPAVPEEMKKECVQLEQIDTSVTKLSEVIKTVTDNYSNYHECKIKVDTWIEWYKIQKSIFEEVK